MLSAEKRTRPPCEFLLKRFGTRGQGGLRSFRESALGFWPGKRRLVVGFGLLLLCPRLLADLWTTAYYPGYRQTYLPASNIDFTAVSHVIHFSVVPNPDGTLNTNANGLTPARSADLLSRAHATGRKVLFCVGGANSQPGFQGATTAVNRSGFISNLTNFMSAYGYDGIDLDWEPLPASDFSQYTNLVNDLRAALNGIPGHKLLTAAAPAYSVYGDPPPAEYAMFAAIQGPLDQINIMTYDLSGPYAGWVTWFNSPLYDGGYRFPSNGRLVPSIDGSVNNFLSNGVTASKLGIGIPFYGKVWTHGAGTSTGGTLLPRQTWTNAPTASAFAYSQISSNYYQSNLYHWDTAAQAAYLSITNAAATNDEFISYDNEYSCQEKISYARNHFLGGVMIWELGQGYLAAQPAGQRDPLLQAIKQALATPQFTESHFQQQDVYLSFTTLPLASYRVLWTTNLTAVVWNTLTSNVPGTGGLLHITDAGALSGQARRFYRVQTPP